MPGEHHAHSCAYNTKSYWPWRITHHETLLYSVCRRSSMSALSRRRLQQPMDNADRRHPLHKLGLEDGAAVPPTAASRTPARRAAAGLGSGKVRRIVRATTAATGEIVRFYEGSVPGDGATLTTAGESGLRGDLNQQLRKFDAYTGKVLRQTTVPGPIQTSTITYRVTVNSTWPS